MSSTTPTDDNDRDKRSIFVKNVHFSAKKDEIEDEFKASGKVMHVTIVHDKMTR